MRDAWKEIDSGIFGSAWGNGDTRITALVLKKEEGTWRLQMLFQEKRLAYINNLPSKQDAIDFAESIAAKVIQK